MTPLSINYSSAKFVQPQTTLDVAIKLLDTLAGRFHRPFSCARHSAVSRVLRLLNIFLRRLTRSLFSNSNFLINIFPLPFRSLSVLCACSLFLPPFGGPQSVSQSDGRSEHRQTDGEIERERRRIHSFVLSSSDLPLPFQGLLYLYFSACHSRNSDSSHGR